MGFLNRKENGNSFKNLVEQRKKEGDDLFREFVNFAKENKYLYESRLYYKFYYLLSDKKDDIGFFDDDKDKMDDILKEMKSLIEEYKGNSDSYTEIVKQNISNMKAFVELHKKFFVIERLFKEDEDTLNEVVLCGFTYNMRYDENIDAIRCLAITTNQEKAERWEIKASNWKIREMTPYDFGMFADGRLEQKSIKDVSKLEDSYKSLQELYTKEELKPF